MILYESDSVILSFDSSVPCLDFIIKQSFRNSKGFKESHKISIEKYIELKQKYPELGIFIDARDLYKIKKRDIDWLSKEVFPKYEEAGLRKKAFFFISNETGKTVMEQYKGSLNGSKIVLNEFSTYKAAKRWLKITESEHF